MSDSNTPQAPASMTEDEILSAVKDSISQNEIMIFMKGTPDFPQCGFSGRSVEILKSLQKPFAAMNVLADPRIRQTLSAESNWPTIPQIFFKGEFIGGCDILVELHEKGELSGMLQQEAEQNA